MIRRAVAVALLVLGLVLASASPAQAFCMAREFDDLVMKSEVVWWATVTDAVASRGHRPGIWTLTVRIDDVLKGPGVEGGVGTVYVSTCGPVILPAQAKEAAPSFVGNQSLYIGRFDHDGLVAFSDVIEPQGRTPERSYEKALALLGLSSPTQTPDAPPGEEPGEAPSGGFPLGLAVGGGLAALVVGTSLLFLARRRRIGSAASERPT